jgi:hypothetical protein
VRVRQSRSYRRERRQRHHGITEPIGCTNHKALWRIHV